MKVNKLRYSWQELWSGHSFGQNNQTQFPIVSSSNSPEITGNSILCLINMVSKARIILIPVSRTQALLTLLSLELRVAVHLLNDVRVFERIAHFRLVLCLDAFQFFEIQFLVSFQCWVDASVHFVLSNKPCRAVQRTRVSCSEDGHLLPWAVTWGAKVVDLADVFGNVDNAVEVVPFGA